MSLMAGLLHDAGKGQTGFAPRIIHYLGQAYGAWIPSLARRLPGMRGRAPRLAHASRNVGPDGGGRRLLGDGRSS